MPKKSFRRTGDGNPVPQCFFNYFGSKHSITNFYLPPEHDTIIEPFAGSAAYSTRWYDRKVLLYDVDPKVFGTWKYLISVSVAEILKLPIRVESTEDLKLPQEAKWLIGWWLKPGNTFPYTKPSTRFLKTGENQHRDNHWGYVVRHRIAKNVEKIRHWKVFNQSWETASAMEATWFVDPPYQRSGKTYVFHDVNYQALTKWFNARKGLAIGCGQMGDDWLPFKKLTEIKNVNNNRSVEVVYVRRKDA